MVLMEEIHVEFLKQHIKKIKRIRRVSNLQFAQRRTVMRKIEGLKFLQRFFPDQCVDCIFVTDKEPIILNDLEKHASSLFRVRSSRRNGSDINAPSKTCHSVKEVVKFVEDLRSLKQSWEFVIHRVDKAYFTPSFIGTIALFYKVEPQIMIDLQYVPSRDAQAIANGAYHGQPPRDWKVAAMYTFPFFGRQPWIRIIDPLFQLSAVSEFIPRLWRIGREIDDVKQSLDDRSSAALPESVTRFNLYSDGSILLDDHRNVSSFI